MLLLLFAERFQGKVLSTFYIATVDDIVILLIVAFNRCTRTHTSTPETGEDSNIKVHVPGVSVPDPRESSAEAPDRNVTSLKDASGVNSSSVTPTVVRATGPEYLKLPEPNQVYPSKEVCEGDADRNVTVAEARTKEDISTRYVKANTVQIPCLRITTICSNIIMTSRSCEKIC